MNGYLVDPRTLIYQDIVDISKRIEEAHYGQASSRPLSKGYELRGQVGQWRFAWDYGFLYDTSILPWGDGRIDFTCRNGLTIDLKTARLPLWLPREVSKDHADILVLAGVSLAKRTYKFHGWEWDTIMTQQPQGTLGKFTIVNYLMPVGDLRPMSELVNIINE